MSRQGNITEVGITGGEFAGNQLAKCPTGIDPRQFLRHLVDELISDSPNMSFRFVNSDGTHEFDRRDVTSIAVTFS